MTKDQFLQKYYTKMPPGTDGTHDVKHLLRNWNRDKGAKITQNEFDALVAALK